MSGNKPPGDSSASASLDPPPPGAPGGHIPGTAGEPAFVLHAPSASAIPVLIAAPHGGRRYPPALLGEMRYPPAVLLRLEDRHVDRLAVALAAQTGADLLIARAPRAMIDLNRAPDDVDWDMFVREAQPPGGGGVPSRRVRSGLGLVPRRLLGLGELWRRKLRAADFAERIAGVHEPYHAALAGALAAMHERWGAALLIDLHSMPPLPVHEGAASAQIVIGDRFGASCHGSLVANAFAHFSQCGREAAHNRPYAGGYVLERHGSPRRGIHALQLEIDRSRYLDGDLAEIGPGFEGLVSDLAALVRRLGALTSELADNSGKGWPQAAE